jgi:hypothetical protein
MDTTPAISNPIPNKITPALGWKTNQDIATANKNNGKHTTSAAISIARLRNPDKNPPNKGTYPIRFEIGKKKAQMENTI